MESNFTRVKEAVPPHAQAILSEYGIKHTRGTVELSGDWTTGFLCPFCGDKSGSGSFTPKLYFKCHQCSYKGDVFEWVSRLGGISQWEACKVIGERCGVPVEGKSRKAISGRTMPGRMTEEIAEVAVADLWENPKAEPERQVLKERGFTDQRLLVRLGIGWIKGWLVFPTWNDRGELQERYRGWSPSDPKVKWRWFGNGTGGPGIWPGAPAPEGTRILLCEGEGDVLTALCRLRMHENGWHVATWTAGATSSPAPHHLPVSWRGREVHVAYDNDVFQGPDYPKYVVVTKPGKNPDHARNAAKQRLRKLLEGVCPTLRSIDCTVIVRQCPVDPATNYGGDLRDWVNDGGNDFDDWKAYPFEKLPSIDRVVTDIAFDDLWDSLTENVRTTMQVEAIGGDDLNVPETLKMDCELGQHTACASCPGSREFPDGIIEMAEWPRELAVGLASDNPNDYWSRNIVRRPKGCPRLELVTVRGNKGSIWRAMRPSSSESSAQRSILVVGRDRPSLSGDIEVVGVPHSNIKGNKLVLHAREVNSLDKAVDLEPHAFDFLQHLPHSATQIEEIDEFLWRRWCDLSFNVTKVYGRQDVLTTFDLLAHSVIEMPVEGAVERGWLDVAIIGATRSGKSRTVTKMIEFVQMGKHYTAVSNISRAGIVMGADKLGMLQPGAFPRANGKMFWLDETHFLVQNELRRGGEHPLSWLQSARAEGKVSGIKQYGARDLPARVRLGLISNWMDNSRRRYQFRCQHLLALYGTPETLARLDFGIAVDGKPTQNTLERTRQWWTPERTSALMKRAWSQKASQVVITDEAMTAARDAIDGWEGIYDAEVIPLFTPEEKLYSVLRTATALANLCFSHPKHDLNGVEVRGVHVEWVRRWFERCWEVLEYKDWSERRTRSQQVGQPLLAEKVLTFDIGLDDFDRVETVLGSLMRPNTSAELAAITGRPMAEITRWISIACGLNILDREAPRGLSHVVYYTPTDGGQRLISSIIAVANNDPERYNDRYKHFARFMMTNEGNLSFDREGLEPLGEEVFGDDEPFGQAPPF